MLFRMLLQLGDTGGLENTLVKMNYSYETY
jgi:hypothetical protein